MSAGAIPSQALKIILQNAARRGALLEILWHERYLTREQLISRVEIQLGANCFGASAWEDNFYRDMRIFKQALQAAGQRLRFSRSQQLPGYYLQGQPALSQEFKQMLAGSSAEADPAQISIYHRLSLCERIRQGCSISNTARRAAAYRIRQENPGISQIEANRMALQRANTA